MANNTIIEMGDDVDALVLNDVQHNINDRRADEIANTALEAVEALSGDVEALSEDVSSEATARAEADTTLQGNITAEATARAEADTTLQGNITAEATARAEADTTLQGNITAEATARAEADTTLQVNITAEATTRAEADTALQSNITAEATARAEADTTLQGDITAIEDKIPSQASAQNQLADKNFVNSSIATNTANFLGTYTSMAQIEAIQNPTNNDYVYLQQTDSAGNNIFNRYKYNSTQAQWLFEYELNNTKFTAEQWATINSGLTQSVVNTAINTAIDTAIRDLDASAVGGNGKYIASISETDGVISATEGTIDSAVTASSNNPVSSDAVKTYVDTQVAQSIAQVLATGF